MLIVVLQWLFLGDLRSAVIVGATIPFALFFAVSILVLRGELANLLSVGAIDFGLIVDATVIMVEAIFRRLAHTNRLSESEQAASFAKTIMDMKQHAILTAAADVSRSIFFAAAIIIAAFLPLFTLSGVEGNIFSPMARTYAYALAGGLLATFTVTPALCAIILPAHVEETETFIMRFLHRLYMPVLARSLANRRIVLSGRRGADHHDGCRRASARSGISAEARGRQSLDPGDAAADDLASGRQFLRQRDAQADCRPDGS